MRRRSTSTSTFGVSRRESHDASGFYARFTPPELSPDAVVAPPAARSIDKLFVGDARRMEEVPPRSVALVVTSPPYFAGKEYEEALGQGGTPATYLGYLQLLRDVFAECVNKLEPGGRIAVNVANLGRRPYRSLSADVIGILQDDLRLLLRGEIVWVKQRGSTGSCAWGSFQRPGNPVLRDLTERVIVASKGRFDRALPPRKRAADGFPSTSTMTREDFMESTLDVWEIPAESATRVGHPAPFPVELPARLIDLYTYRHDLVLDPFVGSGSSAVAAVRSGRHFVGYDLDEAYVQLAERRVARERMRLAEDEQRAAGAGYRTPSTRIPAVLADADPADDAVRRAVREGRAAREIARLVIEGAGFSHVEHGKPQPGGVEVSFTARDTGGRLWLFEVAGTFTTQRPGLRRTDALWKAVAKAAVLRAAGGAPLVLLTAEAPTPGSAGADMLRHVTGPRKPVRAVIEMLQPSGVQALRALGRSRGR